MRGLCALLIALIAAGGCGFGRKPYADDPLLHGGRGVWGDRQAARQASDRALPEPEAPLPPNVPDSIDPFLAGGEARPVTLP
jgi:hypothetical protein